MRKYIADFLRIRITTAMQGIARYWLAIADEKTTRATVYRRNASIIFSFLKMYAAANMSTANIGRQILFWNGRYIPKRIKEASAIIGKLLNDL